MHKTVPQQFHNLTSGSQFDHFLSICDKDVTCEKGQRKVSQSKEEEKRIRGRGRGGLAAALNSFVNICMVDPGKTLHEDKLQCIAIDYIDLTI